MKKLLLRLLFWSPRVLSILFALFLGMFALDVFQEGYGFWKSLLALVIHLAPFTGLVIVALIVAWRWELVGAILFVCIGILYIVQFGARWKLTAYLLIPGPMFLIGLLFLMGWIFRRSLHSIHAPDVNAKPRS